MTNRFGIEPYLQSYDTILPNPSVTFALTLFSNFSVSWTLPSINHKIDDLLFGDRMH